MPRSCLYSRARPRAAARRGRRREPLHAVHAQPLARAPEAVVLAAAARVEQKPRLRRAAEAAESTSAAAAESQRASCASRTAEARFAAGNSNEAASAHAPSTLCASSKSRIASFHARFERLAQFRIDQVIVRRDDEISARRHVLRARVRTRRAPPPPFFLSRPNARGPRCPPARARRTQGPTAKSGPPRCSARRSATPSSVCTPSAARRRSARRTSLCTHICVREPITAMRGRYRVVFSSLITCASCECVRLAYTITGPREGLAFESREPAPTRRRRLRLRPLRRAKPFSRRRARSSAFGADRRGGFLPPGARAPRATRAPRTASRASCRCLRDRGRDEGRVFRVSGGLFRGESDPRDPRRAKEALLFSGADRSRRSGVPAAGVARGRGRRRRVAARAVPVGLSRSALRPVVSDSSTFSIIVSWQS